MLGTRLGSFESVHLLHWAHLKLNITAIPNQNFLKLKLTLISTLFVFNLIIQFLKGLYVIKPLAKLGFSILPGFVAPVRRSKWVKVTYILLKHEASKKNETNPAFQLWQTLSQVWKLLPESFYLVFLVLLFHILPCWLCFYFLHLQLVPRLDVIAVLVVQLNYYKPFKKWKDSKYYR